MGTITNEELAALAQAGDQDALLTLWEGVRRLAWKQMHRWSWAGKAAGMEPADFEQVAFLALLMAVRGYVCDGRAKFSTWYCIHLQSEVFKAAGLHGKKAQRDPLRTAVSLDLPASSDAPEGTTLGELIEDPEAEAPFLASDLEAAIAEVLAELPDRHRQVILDKYWRDESVDMIAHAAALRALRHPSKSKRLRKLL